MNELIKYNLKGHFRWSTYCKPNNHDKKFGPTVSEYVCQIPVVGLIPTAIFYGGVYTAIGVVKIIGGNK